MTRPRISVVIPTLNAADRISNLIQSLRTQSVVPDEILIVDSSSEDATQEIVHTFSDVELQVIDRSTFNHGMTRHQALLDTTGDYVCFLTDDAVPATQNFIENLTKPLDDPMVAMASGRQLPKANARRFEQLIREFNYPGESNVRTRSDLPMYGIKTYFATDVCSVYRRASYLEVGGFQRVNTNEDMLIAAAFINNGYKVAYAADAEVFHSHNLSPSQQYARNKAVGYFLESHTADLSGVGEVGEGKRLVSTVARTLLREGSIGELFAFGIDCGARFLGNRAGRRQARIEMERDK